MVAEAGEQAGVGFESSAKGGYNAFAPSLRQRALFLPLRPARHLLRDGGRASKGMGPIPIQPDPLGPRLQRRHRWRRRNQLVLSGAGRTAEGDVWKRDNQTDNRRDLCTRHGCPAGYLKPVVLSRSQAAERVSIHCGNGVGVAALRAFYDSNSNKQPAQSKCVHWRRAFLVIVEVDVDIAISALPKNNRLAPSSQRC